MATEQHDEDDTQDDSGTLGHVVQAKRRYRRAKDEEKDLRELIDARASKDGVLDEYANDGDEDAGDLDAEEATFKKRYGDLRRHMQSVQTEHRKEMQQLEGRMTKAEGGKSFSLPKSEAEIATWSKKYPDVAKMMESIALKKSGDVASSMKKEMEGLQEMRREITRGKAEGELLQLHPDFDAIRKDPAFHAWAGIQPKWVQDSLYENEDNALACSKAITLYKAETRQLNGPSDAAKKVRNKSGTNVSTEAGSKAKWKESQVASMTARQYENNEKSITNSISNGTFVYDLSGAAR